MGIENMRRWPMYIVFAVCLLLLLSLFNSWSIETELRNKVIEISLQLKECSKQQTSCMEESLTLTEQRDRYLNKVNELDKKRLQLNYEVSEYKEKLTASDARANRSIVDAEICKNEVQSLQSLKLTTKASLETMRLEILTLTTQLKEKKNKIYDLENEMEKLKSTLNSRSSPNVPLSAKVTPAAQPPKISPALNANNPINEPVLENNAKEDIEDINAINDGADFDPQLQ